jgi:hypothetical protein
MARQAIDFQEATGISVVCTITLHPYLQFLKGSV